MNIVNATYRYKMLDKLFLLRLFISLNSVGLGGCCGGGRVGTRVLSRLPDLGVGLGGTSRVASAGAGREVVEVIEF